MRIWRKTREKNKTTAHYSTLFVDEYLICNKYGLFIVIIWIHSTLWFCRLFSFQPMLCYSWPPFFFSMCLIVLLLLKPEHTFDKFKFIFIHLFQFFSCSVACSTLFIRLFASIRVSPPNVQRNERTKERRRRKTRQQQRWKRTTSIKTCSRSRLNVMWMQITVVKRLVITFVFDVNSQSN